MSAASSLLRRRSSQALTALLKHRQKEIEYFSAFASGSFHGLQNSAAREHHAVLQSTHTLSQEFRHAASRIATKDNSIQFYSQNRNSLGAVTGSFRRFATNGNGSSMPSPSPSDESSGTGARVAKISAVAVTVAALTWVAYWALEGDTQDVHRISEWWSRFRGDQPAPGAFEVKDETVRTEQVVKAPENIHQSNEKAETEDQAESTDATAVMTKICEETDREPHVIADSNSMLEVIKRTPLKPEAMEDFLSKPPLPGISDEMSREHDKEKYPDTNFQLSEDTGGFPQNIAKSTTDDFKGDELKQTTFLLKIEDEESLLSENINHVVLGDPESDQASGQPDEPISTQIEDLEPDPFRKEMQETAKEEDLKEFSDRILYNHTSDDGVEKQIKFSNNNTEDRQSENELLEVVTETAESMTDLDQALKRASVEGCAPQVLHRLAVSYFLSEAQKKEALKKASVETCAPHIVDRLADSYFLSQSKRKEKEELIAEECASDGDEDTKNSPYNRGASGDSYAGAIQEAERKQVEADAQFREMLLKLDEEYQQELREARKQQELQAEYASKLEKDLTAERERLQAQAKQELHQVEEKLRNTINQKEEEARRELEKMELLSQARTSAAVTMEKARQLEDTKDVQNKIEALLKAYNAQSEGARVSHTTHKLAMGAFALEDAMARGGPIEKEVELLRQATGGIGNDELIDVALQSLPQEILKDGTLTQSQLQYEFKNLLGPVRQLALIPAGQGGLLTHVIASAAAAVKVREGSGRGGVESVIASVEKCLVNGQLAEAADILEQGVKGTRAEVFVADWARHARARVVAEQTLTLVQAHAIATAAGLA